MRHAGDALAGGAVEAVLARAGGLLGDDVHGDLKVEVCGSVGDGPRVRTQQEVQEGFARLLLGSQYG